MKKMRRLSVLALFLIAVLALSGCSALSPKKGTVSGTITDSISQLGVEGALVTVGTESVKTESNGFYSIQVVPGDYTLKVEKAGHTTLTSTVKVTVDTVTEFNSEMVDNRKGTITGIVTDGRGGPVVEGVTINLSGLNGYTDTTTTDANGQFQFELKPDFPVELIVTAENRATMRVQAVQTTENSDFFIEVPTRDLFNPNWSAEPPTISTNITPNQLLHGNQELTVNVTGERSTYLIYAYLGGNHRNPRTMFESDTDTATVTVDTTLFPNGKTFLKVLVYDDNENGALYVLPVRINNSTNDTARPAALSNLKVASVTHGQNLGFYNFDDLAKRVDDANLVKTLENTIQAAPAGADSSVTVTWAAAEGADGYNVYRAFGSVVNGELVFGDLEFFSSVPAPNTSLADYSSQIEANVPMLYSVEPYNSYGKGEALTRMVMPLPSFNTYLETPANESTNVGLQPTFTWRHDVVGGNMPAGISFSSDLSIYDGTSGQIWVDTIDESIAGSTYTLPISLENNKLYSWDISYSEAFGLWEYDDFGYSYSLSVAGELNETGGSGSINGEYLFTTTIGQ